MTIYLSHILKPKRFFIKIVALIFIGLASNQVLSQSNIDIVVCTLKNSGAEYVGTCSVPCPVNALKANFDKLLEACKSDTPPRTVIASLKKIDEKGNYLGKMEGKYPEDPTRFEIADSKYVSTKIAKLPFGWFPLQSISQSSDELILSINAQTILPATPDDIKIMDRALELLSSQDIWNKNDNRICPPNPNQWSLFCALTQATVEVSGGVHYRQPAHEKVREVLNEVGGNRVKTHRLMDYNNHPDTTLDDVRNLLINARARIQVN
jgi:hypothetical protein